MKFHSFHFQITLIIIHSNLPKSNFRKLPQHKNKPVQKPFDNISALTEKNYGTIVSQNQKKFQKNVHTQRQRTLTLYSKLVLLMDFEKINNLSKY